MAAQQRVWQPPSERVSIENIHAGAASDIAQPTEELARAHLTAATS
jgi:hypothetical protein